MTRPLILAALLIALPANTFALTEAEVKELCKDGCVLMTQAQFDAAMRLIHEAKDCKRI